MENSEKRMLYESLKDDLPDMMEFCEFEEEFDMFCEKLEDPTSFEAFKQAWAKRYEEPEVLTLNRNSWIFEFYDDFRTIKPPIRLIDYFNDIEME